jgi:hypothetical protein
MYMVNHNRRQKPLGWIHEAALMPNIMLRDVLRNSIAAWLLHEIWTWAELTMYKLI